MTKTGRKVNRNQHYLPQYYLRNFSTNGNTKAINSFLINTQKVIKNTSIKNQASKANYFNEYDTYFSVQETNIGALFKKIIAGNEPSGIEDHSLLLTFIVTTKHRNPTSHEQIKNLPKLLKQILSPENSSEQIQSLMFDMSHSETLQMSVESMIDAIANLTDLSYKIVSNKTEKPFITSNFPIAQYNLFFERRNFTHIGIGYGSKGLIISFPISPNKLIFFYDSSIYNVGKRSNKIIEVNQIETVNQFNLMQFLNGGSQIYFDDKASDVYIKGLYKKSLNNQVANKTRMKFSTLFSSRAESLKTKEEKKNNLIVSSKSELYFGLKLPFIALRKSSFRLNPNNSNDRLRPLTHYILNLKEKFGRNYLSKMVPSQRKL